MDDGQEKTESATSKHKLDARKKGTVARSTDLVNACCIISLLIVLPIATSSFGAGTISSFRGSLAYLPTDMSFDRVVTFSVSALHPVLPGLAMIVATSLCVGLAVNFTQVGFVLSGQALTPNFGKLNPFNGVKRLLSRSSAFDTAKGLWKAVLFSLIAYGCIRSNWDQLNSLNQVSVNDALVVVGAILRSLGLRIACTWGVLAGLDYFFQRQQVERQLRMSKTEVRREMREMEMAPEIKMARNVRRRRLMRQRMREAVKSADLVVTNPTHYAVALKYEMGRSYAPVVVAKGIDFLAARIKEEALLSEVPIVPNPPLARALYKQCEIGDHVPRELFQAVAEVLAYVYRTIKKMPR